MAITKYEAKFIASNGAEIVKTREYAKPLSFAWRVEYCNAADHSQKAEKFGFSATKEAAEKATKLPKRCKALHTEIVEAVNLGEVAKATKPGKVAKAKAAKPCAVGDIVTFELGTQLPGVSATIGGKVAKLGRVYAYVEVAGALDPIKVAFANITKPAPVAPALAAAA